MPQQVAFIPSEPNYQFGTVLDGTQYLFDVRWNGRDDAWYFDLLSEDETLLLAGIKIVLGVFMGNRSVDANWPTGAFIAGDLSGAGIDAGLDDLGVRVMVYYYTLAELDAL